MHGRIFFLILAAAVWLFAVVAHPQGKPIPPGVREADKQTNAPIEPPANVKAKTKDSTKLRQEADELAKLSSAIPPEIDLVSRGQLPKDLDDQLKRIEKLAKHLRSEIAP